MITSDNQIFLTYKLGGESLVKAGVYKSAEIKVKNSWLKNEEVTMVKPMRTISEAEYSHASNKVVMSSAFTAMCLERPKPPKDRNINRWLRTTEGVLYSNWKNLSIEQRVYAQIQIYVNCMSGELIDYTII